MKRPSTNTTLIAISLIVALLFGLAGGFIAGRYSRHAEVRELQNQVEELKTAQRSPTLKEMFAGMVSDRFDELQAKRKIKNGDK